MTILFGTKLVALSAPAGQRPWTVADRLVRDSKCSLPPIFIYFLSSLTLLIFISRHAD